MRAEVRKAMLAAGAKRPGRRFPEAAKAAMTRFASEKVANGQTLAEVARELELSVATLNRWAGSRPAFVPVEVAPQGVSSITVRGPQGLVIEGLSMEQLAELLRRIA